MAHDPKHQKIEFYVYDKIFRREKTRGQPIKNLENIPLYERGGIRFNNELVCMIKTKITVHPNWTVQQFNTYFHKELDASKWLRYFKDYQLKQSDLPISESLVRDMYHKLWGVPLTMDAAHLSSLPGLEHLNDLTKIYRTNLKEITRKLLQEDIKRTKKDLEKIIYQHYPIESELLLNYINKYKHLMK